MSDSVTPVEIVKNSSPSVIIAVLGGILFVFGFIFLLIGAIQGILALLILGVLLFAAAVFLEIAAVVLVIVLFVRRRGKQEEGEDEDDVEGRYRLNSYRPPKVEDDSEMFVIGEEEPTHDVQI
eukprot:TRINITY_DN10950_c0_g1_i1.p1 TRINITY_DN10950_c0_g1~~TRINITY_DN10950_c0_g1_i1.p1  ORF type:complete len:123 (-),score=45.03 TRINITY_DN10950_c0_g1_i1:81-449(-)